MLTHTVIVTYFVNCSKDRTTDVIHQLLNKFNVVDSPSRFVLYEKDVLTSKKIVVLLLCYFY